MPSTLLHSDFCAAIIWFEGSGDEIAVMQSLCDVRVQAHHKRWIIACLWGNVCEDEGVKSPK